MTEQNVPDVTSSGVVAGNAAYGRFVKSLQQIAEVSDGTASEQLDENQFAAMMEAESLDDLLNIGADGLQNGTDLIDVEQEITAYRLATGTREEFANRYGVYAIVNSKRLDTGEEVAWNTGAPHIIKVLRFAEIKGWFPFQCVIRGTKTGNGTMLNLRPLPKRAVSGKSATS